MKVRGEGEKTSTSNPFLIDKNRGNPEAEAKFKEISHAYDVLNDPQKRTLYDQYGEAGLEGGAGGGGMAAEDLFAQFFGGGGGATAEAEVLGEGEIRMHIGSYWLFLLGTS